MMEQTYEQKKARDQLLGSLSEGYLTFDKDGIIDQGATKITEELLETNLFESDIRKLRIWDILFKEEDKKNHFKKMVEKV